MMVDRELTIAGERFEGRKGCFSKLGYVLLDSVFL
jgi:hypothetical protein